MREMTDPPLARTVETFKALAHPARLRILGMLRSGPLCVCQVTAALELAVSTVSAHLAELKRAGLVLERRDRRWVSYRLAEDPDAKALLGQVFRLVSRDGRVAADGCLARGLRRVPVEELCRVELDLTRVGLKPAGGGTEGRSMSWRRA